jgi:hypothetical protein
LSGYLCFSSIEVKAQSNLNSSVNSYIKKLLSSDKDEGNVEENKDARKIVKGDLNRGRKEDAAMFIVILQNDNNSWEYHLAVFLNKKGKYEFADETVVGGRFIGNYTLKSIKNQKILG